MPITAPLVYTAYFFWGYAYPEEALPRTWAIHPRCLHALRPGNGTAYGVAEPHERTAPRARAGGERLHRLGAHHLRGQAGGAHEGVENRMNFRPRDEILAHQGAIAQRKVGVVGRDHTVHQRRAAVRHHGVRALGQFHGNARDEGGRQAVRARLGPDPPPRLDVHGRNHQGVFERRLPGLGPAGEQDVGGGNAQRSRFAGVGGPGCLDVEVLGVFGGFAVHPEQSRLCLDLALPVHNLDAVAETKLGYGDRAAIRKLDGRASRKAHINCSAPAT